jgi:uncharacterized membrane protein
MGLFMLKKIFIRGLIAVLPVALTAVLCIWIFRSLEDFFGFWLRQILPPGTYFKGLGILVGISLIFFIGILIQAWMVDKIYHYFEKLLQKIPFIKTIYNAFSDVMQFFDQPTTARRAVIVELPYGRVIGFITADNADLLPPGLLKPDEVLIYIPLSYQVGGITIAWPRAQTQAFDWPADKAMSFVLTAGLAGKAHKK